MWKSSLNVTANVIYSTYAHVSHSKSPPWSKKGVCTWPPESEKYLLTERKEFSVTLFQRAGAWICSSIYIYLCKEEWAFCDAGKRLESPPPLSSSQKKDLVSYNLGASVLLQEALKLIRIDFPLEHTVKYRLRSVDIISG